MEVALHTPQLRGLRESRAMTQEELADRAGVGRTTVWRAEHEYAIAAKSVRALAKALRVSVEELQRPAEK